MKFEQFAKAVNEQFKKMAAEGIILRTNTGKEELKASYLKAFPTGSNPIYITNTEHDCSCCKQFIYNVGNLVSLKNGQLSTVWDVTTVEPYQTVANKMSTFIKSQIINGIFYATEKRYGAYKTTQQLENGQSIDWNHFYCEMPTTLFKGDKVGELAGKDTTSATMLAASINLFDVSYVDTVIDLIKEKAIYRGEEHLPTILGFKELITKFQKYNSTAKLFGLENFNHPQARFKNTVIGTLVEDLSNGTDLESAVKSFEAKVAPANYKRSSALITQGMIKQAMTTITDLGLEPALSRKHATIHDMNINDVLWADHSVQSQMQGVETLLQQVVQVNKPSTDKAINISIEDFMSYQLPTATSIEALIDNKHQSNFMNIIAPNEVSPHLLKWDNNFTWSYNGNVADSMKEIVKSFGGKINAQFRCSIMWNENNDNPDDLDLHCISPYGHIYYGNKRESEPFNLDIDITSPGNKVAVENITHDFSNMKPGIYKLFVHNYANRRASSGFKAEIEFNGQVFEYSQLQPVTRDVDIATVIVKNNEITIKHHMKPSTSSKEIYNLKTNTFVKVNNIMLSPNHWGENSSGNKHFMFILDNCKTTDKVRGFYNEFLSNSLTPHRKVFEVLASKMQVEPTDNQLAGLGFSSTVKNDLILKVANPTSTKLYKIQF